MLHTCMWVLQVSFVTRRQLKFFRLWSKMLQVQSWLHPISQTFTFFFFFFFFPLPLVKCTHTYTHTTQLVVYLLWLIYVRIFCSLIVLMVFGSVRALALYAYRSLCLADHSCNICFVSAAVGPSSSMSRLNPSNLSSWSVDDVCYWLIAHGLGNFVDTFRDNEVDGECLLTLDNKLLRDDLGITALGHRSRILKRVESLKKEIHPA